MLFDGILPHSDRGRGGGCCRIRTQPRLLAVGRDGRLQFVVSMILTVSFRLVQEEHATLLFLYDYSLAVARVIDAIDNVPR